MGPFSTKKDFEMSDEIVLRIPLYEEEDFKSDKKMENLISGSESNGLMIGITKSNIVINGYYTVGSKKYKCLTKGVKMSWEEIRKLQNKLTNKGKRKSKVIKEEFIDGEYTQEYLNTLPIVTINNVKFYIDTQKRERRAVSNPDMVSRF